MSGSTGDWLFVSRLLQLCCCVSMGAIPLLGGVVWWVAVYVGYAVSVLYVLCN
jgi:hypothetical protein